MFCRQRACRRGENVPPAEPVAAEVGTQRPDAARTLMATGDIGLRKPPSRGNADDPYRPTGPAFADLGLRHAARTFRSSLPGAQRPTERPPAPASSFPAVTMSRNRRDGLAGPSA